MTAEYVPFFSQILVNDFLNVQRGDPSDSGLSTLAQDIGVVSDRQGKAMKVRDVLKILKNDGWFLARTKGSHRHFKHPRKPGIVTVAGKESVDVPTGTLKIIWRQAQLDDEEN